MDSYPEWRIRRDAKIHAKWFGYPDESGKSNITGIPEYVAVSKSRLNLSVETKNTGSVYSGSYVNN